MLLRLMATLFLTLCKFNPFLVRPAANSAEVKRLQGAMH